MRSSTTRDNPSCLGRNRITPFRAFGGVQALLLATIALALLLAGAWIEIAPAIAALIREWAL